MIIARKSSPRSVLRKLTELKLIIAYPNVNDLREFFPSCIVEIRKCLLFLYEADIGEEENLCGVTCLVKIGNLKFES